jgi:glycogen debranching enzyme
VRTGGPLLGIISRLWQEIEFLRAPEGYLRAGWPRYYSFFGRDAFLSSLQLLSFDPEIALCSLSFSARFQGKDFVKRTGEEPGKIVHQVYGSKDKARFLDILAYGKKNYFSVDSTPLWIILAHRYWKNGYRKDVMLALKDSIFSALSWLMNRIRKDTFLVYDKSHILGFTHQGWRDGILDNLDIPLPVALADAQAYAYAAFRGGAELVLECFGEKELAVNLLREAEKLKRLFNVCFWWRQEQTYAFAISGSECLQVRRVVPDIGACLFSGIISEDRIPYIVERIFMPDLWTKYGFRSLAIWDKLFREDSYHSGSIWPWQNWIIWLGLKELGYEDRAEMVRSAMLSAFEKLNCIPEAFGVSLDEEIIFKLKRANPIQAWSAGALLSMV